MENKKVNNESKKSNIFLENRKSIEITGVFEVLGFDEEKVLLNTVLKKLEICGNNLKICKLDLKNGEVNITGNINECKYLDNTKKRKSRIRFLKRILNREKKND